MPFELTELTRTLRYVTLSFVRELTFREFNFRDNWMSQTREIALFMRRKIEKNFQAREIQLLFQNRNNKLSENVLL